MNAYITDLQNVPATEGPLFSLVQQDQSLITLTNMGESIVQYRFQQSADGVAWTDLAASGTDLYNTLTASPPQTKFIKLGPTTYPSVRLVGSASGGSAIQFTVSRLFTRPDGGALPLMSF